MAKRKVVEKGENSKDLTVQIVIRSSQLKVTELREFNRRLIDFLSTQPETVQLVSDTFVVQRDSEKTLLTLTSNLEAID